MEREDPGCKVASLSLSIQNDKQVLIIFIKHNTETP